MEILPALGNIKLINILMVVLLPAPFSPSTATTSPAPTAKLTSCSARTPGNDFPTPDISKSSGMVGTLTNPAATASFFQKSASFGETGNSLCRSAS